MANVHAPTSSALSAQEKEHASRSRKLASMGMVLLENHGGLPLQEGKTIALFGNGVRSTVKGGSGSGDVNCREVINIERAFEEAGYQVTTKPWLDRYETAVREAHLAYMMRLQERIATEGMGAALDYLLHPFQAPPVVPVSAEDLCRDADTALYVLSRNSGEGADRKPIPGDYRLYPEEEALLDELLNAYRQVILVLNVGGVIDSSYFKGNDRIAAVLLMSQGGTNGARALVDVLTGAVTPSGHLTTTWAAAYEDYPGAGSFSHMNGDLDDEYYHEGIFVGYRYFDSFQVKPNYPFGYGLSYTTFSVETTKVEVSEEVIKVHVAVKNTGDTYSGREVVQVYASAPEGQLVKPCKELVAFGKTKELLPGESDELILSFETAQMASYDEKSSAWVLEKGEYLLRVGTDCESTKVAARIQLDETAAVSKLSGHLPGDPELEEITPPDAYRRSDPTQEHETTAAAQFVLTADKILCKTAEPPAHTETVGSDGTRPITLEDVRSGNASIHELTAQLTVEEMAELCVGTARSGPGANSMIGAASNQVPGAAGDTSSVLLESRSIPNLILADGPAGLRLSKSFATDTAGCVIPGTESMPLADFDVPSSVTPETLPAGAIMRYQYCTAIPIATMLAQTWDLDAVEEAGDLVGAEMEQFGVHLWLAPGMNIHRNPLCGRNFEYYSEDPLLSGKCAAADTKGVQKHKGCGTTIKHFACNNQEDNRTHTNAHVSERALREIYLKGFEIAVKESHPKAIMTSYNLLNGIHTANHYDLITSVARREWGFSGLVMTDWGTTGRMELLSSDENFKYGCSSAAGCIKAGNDLIMPGSQEDMDEIICSVAANAGQENGSDSLSVAELRDCAEHILQVILELT